MTASLAAGCSRSMTRPARRPAPLRHSRRSASASSAGSGDMAGNSRVAPHPASVDPVLEPPQCRRHGPRKGRARRPPARRRCRSAPTRAAAARRGAGSYRRARAEDLQRAADLAELHRRPPYRAGGLSSSRRRRQRRCASRRASAAFRRSQRSPRRQRQTGLPEPRRGSRLGHPQRLVELDPLPSAQTSVPGSTRTISLWVMTVIPRSPRIRSKSRRTADCARAGACLAVTSVTSSESPQTPRAGAAPTGRARRRRRRRRPRQAAAAASQARVEQRLPARRKMVDRLDCDGIFGRAWDIV